MLDFLKRSNGQIGIFGKSNGQKSNGQIWIRNFKILSSQIAWKNLTVISKKSNGQMGIFKKSNGQRTIPQIFFGDHHVGGYTELRALEKENKLKEFLE